MFYVRFFLRLSKTTMHLIFTHFPSLPFHAFISHICNAPFFLPNLTYNPKSLQVRGQVVVSCKQNLKEQNVSLFYPTFIAYQVNSSFLILSYPILSSILFFASFFPSTWSHTQAAFAPSHLPFPAILACHSFTLYAPLYRSILHTTISTIPLTLLHYYVRLGAGIGPSLRFPYSPYSYR